MGSEWSKDDLSGPQPNINESKNTENTRQEKPVCVCNTSGTKSNINGNNKAINEAEKTVVPEKINRQKYWVDKMGKNCFMIYARDLSITWSGDNRYWMWRQLNDPSEGSIEVAELQNVCWLEVEGKFDTKKLSPGTSYEVKFVAKLKNPAYGWEVPVNVGLSLPDGRKQDQKVNMLRLPMEQWMEIAVGEFRTSPQMLGEIKFSLYEFEGGAWKRGLLIKGVKIEPKT